MNIKVNGVNLYYEVYGSGKPIILVHGNGETGEIFDVLIDQLKNEYQIYVIDSRCHGRSERTEDISYDLMTDDIIDFVEKLGLDKPLFYGFSDGGIIGLLAVIKKPKMFSEIFISGANLNPGGIKWYFILWARYMYIRKKKKKILMMLKEPNITTDQLKCIKVPVHVIAGEKDIVKKKHTNIIADNIPQSTIDIIPGENHGSYIVHSEKLYYVLKKYL